LIVIPFNALTIGLTGLSLGKWIFGIRVTRDGAPMGPLRALRREFAVFFKGLGLGVPLVSLFTLVGSYSALSDKRITPWDKAQKLGVNHRPESLGASIGMGAAVVLLVLARIWLQVRAIK
jgi:hypothetical protein